VLGLELQQRQGHTGLGVEIAGRAQHSVLAVEDRGHHLLGRRLAIAAGDPDRQRVHAIAHMLRHREKGVPRVAHDDLDHAVGDLGAPLHDQRSGATAEGVGDEAMAVHLAAAQREEDAT